MEKLSGRPSFLEAVKAVVEAEAALPGPSMIIGGLAVIARGVPRFTADIDLTINSGSAVPAEILPILDRAGLSPRIPDAAAFAVRSRVLLLRHEPTGVPVDLSLAFLPFELEAIASRETVKFGGVSIEVPKVEDLVIYKMVAFRPRDVDDVRALLSLYRNALRVERIRGQLRSFCEALEDSERLDRFETLLPGSPGT